MVSKSCKKGKLVKFEVLTSTSINITNFWHVMPCRLVGLSQNFLSISRVDSVPALKRDTHCSIQTLVQSTKPQGIILQHINLRTCLIFKAKWCLDIPPTVTLDLHFSTACHSLYVSRDSQN
jgi:hypothetical protein